MSIQYRLSLISSKFQLVTTFSIKMNWNINLRQHNNKNTILCSVFNEEMVIINNK